MTNFAKYIPEKKAVSKIHSDFLIDFIEYMNDHIKKYKNSSVDIFEAFTEIDNKKWESKASKSQVPPMPFR